MRRVTLTLALCLALPATAQAACGGPVRAYPHHPLGHYRPPLIIGDSTMIFPVPRLARAGFHADARGCRQLAEGMQLIRRRRHSHRLPHLVIVALGANGFLSTGRLERILRIIGPRRTLGLVTQRESGGRAGSDASIVRRMGRRHPNRVKVADWVAYSSGHGAWFSGDGLHLNHRGADAFTTLVSKALMRFAAPPGRKLKTH